MQNSKTSTGVLRGWPALGLLLLTLVLAGTLTSCDLDKQIEVNIPPQASQLAVECYLVPGEIPKVLLTETRPYFEAPNQPFINNAAVELSINGRAYNVPFFPYVDTVANKAYNYTLPTVILGADTGQLFRLRVVDTANRTVSSVAKLLPPARIDSLFYQYRGGDSLASIVCRLAKPGGSGPHFYRMLVSPTKATNGAIRDLLADDAITNAAILPVATDFNFRKGDTLVVRVLHIEREYYDFLQSSRAAQSVAGNPFAQPAPVRSNILNGFGIFTAFMPVEKKIVLK